MTTVVHYQSRKIPVPKEILDAVKIKPGSKIDADGIGRIQEEYFRIEIERTATERAIGGEKRIA